MKKVRGKIILVDDEKYEHHALMHNLKERDWDIEVEYFADPVEALKHMKENEDEIFIIISDMSMPRMNGMEFKKAIDSSASLKLKSIPFIFISHTTEKEAVTAAFEYRVQGYFHKPDTLKEQADLLEEIIKYWISSKHPNKEFLYRDQDALRS